jgi:hypothetical protein
LGSFDEEGMPQLSAIWRAADENVHLFPGVHDPGRHLGLR